MVSLQVTNAAEKLFVLDSALTVGKARDIGRDGFKQLGTKAALAQPMTAPR